MSPLFRRTPPVQPDKPGPGQRSVWEFPRPPALERENRTIRIEFGGERIVVTNSAFRVLETSHPYVYFVPPEDVASDVLVRSPGQQSMCEWKGRAHYFDVVAGGRTASHAAFGYDDPVPAFAAIKGYVSFYAAPMDGCFVDDAPVEPQPGGFYSGWITPDVSGPFKGGRGTMGW